MKERLSRRTLLAIDPVRVALVAVSCVVLVVASIIFVDRALATWVHEHLNGGWLLPFSVNYQGRQLPVSIFMLMAAPAEALGKAATGGLMIMGIAGIVGWRPRHWGQILLAVCIAVVVAITMKEETQVDLWADLA